MIIYYDKNKIFFAITVREIFCAARIFRNFK